MHTLETFPLQFHEALQAAVQNPGVSFELSIGSRKALGNLRHRYRTFFGMAKTSARYRKSLEGLSLRLALREERLGQWSLSLRAVAHTPLPASLESFLQEHPPGA